MKIIINSEFPSLNQIITAAKKSPYAYAEMKNTYTNLVFYNCIKYPKMLGKVDIKIHWVRKYRNTDPDNICGGGQKFILDGLVKAGIIKDDSMKYINRIEHTFAVDKKNPRTEIKILKAGN